MEGEVETDSGGQGWIYGWMEGKVWRDMIRDGEAGCMGGVMN